MNNLEINTNEVIKLLNIIDKENFDIEIPIQRISKKVFYILSWVFWLFWIAWLFITKHPIMLIFFWLLSISLYFFWTWVKEVEYKKINKKDFDDMLLNIHNLCYMNKNFLNLWNKVDKDLISQLNEITMYVLSDFKTLINKIKLIKEWLNTKKVYSFFEINKIIYSLNNRVINNFKQVKELRIYKVLFWEDKDNERIKVISEYKELIRNELKIMELKKLDYLDNESLNIINDKELENNKIKYNLTSLLKLININENNIEDWIKRIKEEFSYIDDLVQKLNEIEAIKKNVERINKIELEKVKVVW